MADIKKLLEQYNNRKENLNKIQVDLEQALMSEIGHRKELLSKVEEMFKQGDLIGVYALLNGNECSCLKTDKNYILMPTASTYAKGVQALRDAGQEEPLSFAGDLRARVEDFETKYDVNGNKRSLGDRLRLFNTWLDSCTGVANKKKSTKFKLIPVCNELIQIASNFDGYFLPVDYNNVEGIELDSRKGKFNQFLTKEQVLVQPAWLAGAEDKELLRDYRDIVWEVYAQKYNENPNKLMGFYVRQNTDNDELRALFVDSLGDYYSGAGSRDSLYYYGCFVRVAPK